MFQHHQNVIYPQNVIYLEKPRGFDSRGVRVICLDFDYLFRLIVYLIIINLTSCNRSLYGVITTSSHLTLVTCIALVVALYRTAETLNTPSYEITVIPSFASFTSLELSARSQSCQIRCPCSRQLSFKLWSLSCTLNPCLHLHSCPIILKTIPLITVSKRNLITTIKTGRRLVQGITISSRSLVRILICDEQQWFVCDDFSLNLSELSLYKSIVLYCSSFQFVMVLGLL